MDLWGFSFWNIPHFQTKQTWTWREFLSSFEVGEHFASETAKNELCWYSPSQNINCCCLSIYISTMIQGKKPTNLLQGVLNKWWWSIHRVRKKEKLMKQKSFQSFFWVLLKKKKKPFFATHHTSTIPRHGYSLTKVVKSKMPTRCKRKAPTKVVQKLK